MRRFFLVFLPALVACASTKPPVDQIAAARTSVGNAQAVAVGEVPVELRTAQGKLARAEQAMQRNDYREARRLAEQADVDAKLARVLVENARAQRGAAEVEQGIEALRAELRSERR
jgi:hypothetical protein